MNENMDSVLQRQFYDIAGTAWGPAIAALRSYVPISQILFGSDHPYVPLHDTAEGFAALTFTDQERQAISRDNALKLLPSLQRK
jgi:predicted TIM-barrel fold metal-dependent hydrolase